MRRTHQHGAFAPGAAASDPTNDNAPVARRVEGLKGDQGHRESTEDGRSLVAQRLAVHERLLRAMAPLEATTPERAQTLLQIRNEIPGLSTTTQESRVLAGLRTGPITTLQFRHYLDVLHPAGRVQGLRKKGAEILTTWVSELTDGGKPHRVAKYVLISSEVIA